jgi:FMN phosphatase YigB (HAD superfamily)
VLASRRAYPMPVIRALVFDLDNCLAAADEAGRALFQPAFDAMARANRGRLSQQTLDSAFEQCWRDALDKVAERHAFPPDVTAAGWEIFRRLRVDRALRGYGDLESLRELRLLRFLVTSGFRRLQESKIAALGIAGLFSEICIDAIDEPARRGKEAIFRDLLQRHALAPQEALVVGDNPVSEISAGNRIGMPTVQILRPGVARGTNATWTVETLQDLRRLLEVHYATEGFG